VIPDMFTSWNLANPYLKRTPAYFNACMEAIEKLLKYICNPIEFCFDTASSARDMINIIEDLLNKVKASTTFDKD